MRMHGGDSHGAMQQRSAAFSATILITMAYEIGRCIGEGDCSKVHLCKKKGDPRNYAIKLVQDNFILNGFTESVLLRMLSHPNIISYVDCVRLENRSGLVLEYFEGDTLLRSFHQDRKFNKQEALSIMKPLMSAVSYLHSKSIVHGDLFPNNILVKYSHGNTASALKVVDFEKANMEFFGDYVNITLGNYVEAYNRKWDIRCVGQSFLYLIQGREAANMFNTTQDLGRLQNPHRLIRGMLHLDPKLRYDADRVLKEIEKL